MSIVSFTRSLAEALAEEGIRVNAVAPEPIWTLWACDLKKQILQLDRMIMAWHRSDETSRRLHYIPGVGPLLATLKTIDSFHQMRGLTKSGHCAGQKLRQDSPFR